VPDQKPISRASFSDLISCGFDAGAILVLVAVPAALTNASAMDSVTSAAKAASFDCASDSYGLATACGGADA